MGWLWGVWSHLLFQHMTWAVNSICHTSAAPYDTIDD